MSQSNAKRALIKWIIFDIFQSGNFANPVYETVYNGTGNIREEKAGLLQNNADETPPPLSEEV